MILARDSTMIGHLGFGRHESAGPIGQREMGSLRVLAPHLRRAATITHLLDSAMTKASTFATALDASPSGIVLVDLAMQILHANAKAEEMLRAGDPIVERNGRLSLRLELVPGRLLAAVEAAATDEAQDRKGMGIPSRWLDGTPSVIHVLPLERRQVRPGLTQRAVAAVFVAEAPAPLQLPADALGLIYSLTPAETRVLELLAEGRTLAEVAAELGSAMTTVRTHLQRIFDKTGCHRQADLIGLARSVTLPA